MRNWIVGIVALLFVGLLPNTASAASCFWVGGTGTWSTSNITSWASSTGGTAGTCNTANYCGATTTDICIFDANSGGGTVTPNFNLTIAGITCGAFTGTLDWSANNTNVTIATATVGGSWNCTGTGTRTIKLGSGTFTITWSGGGTPWSMGTTTNLTFNAGTSTISYGSTGGRTFSGGGLTYNNVTFTAAATVASATNTFSNLTVSGGIAVSLPSAVTQTVATLVVSGVSSSAPAGILSSTPGNPATISLTNSPSLTWTAFSGITFSGAGSGFTATNSFNLGNNSGLTISGPSGGTCPPAGPAIICGMNSNKRRAANDNDPRFYIEQMLVRKAALR